MVDGSNPSRLPTPPSGMPAAIAATDQRENPDEIRAPRTSVHPDGMEKLLAAIDGVDKKLDATNRANDERFKRIESELREHRDQLGTHDQLLRDQSTTMTTLAGSTARAVEHALEAKRDGNRAVDEATKIVKSAIEIHGVSIGTTVDASVKRHVQPLEKKVESLEKSDEKQIELLNGIVKTLGHPWLRRALLICACVGALAGGFAAGYLAKHDRDRDVTNAAPSR